LIKYPKIKQFRDVVRNVRLKHDFQGLDENEKSIYEHKTPYPIIDFVGKVKSHGTNSAIVIQDDEVTFQSGIRTISVKHDNAGFACFAHGLNPKELFGELDNVVIFGEFCGGNIQKGVALNQLSKRFVIFGVKSLLTDEWINIRDLGFDDVRFANKNVFTVDSFKQFEISIDFNEPELAQEKLIRFTDEVEEKCPIGDYFGVTGIGEGIVYSPVDVELMQDSEFWFKVKGEKHSSSKVKTLAPVDIEKLNSIKEFIDCVVTENRLEQGIQHLKEMEVSIERKNTGAFMKWMISDIVSEELDLMTGNGLILKDVQRSISNASREFWFKHTDSI